MSINTYHTLSDLWLNKIINRRRALSTTNTYQYALQNFAKHTGITNITDLTEATLHRYITARTNLSTNTLSLYLIAIRQFAHWCIKKKYMTADPFEDYDIPSPRQKIRHYLTESQLIQLLAYEDPNLHPYRNARNQLAWAIMAMAGLRISEVCGLRLRDIDYEHHLICVIEGKGDKPRTVPLLPALAQRIQAYIPLLPYRYLRTPGPDNYLFPGRPYTAPVTRAALSIALSETTTALGLRNISPHSLRHTFASLLAKANVPIPALQSMLGHTDPKITMIYIHQTTNDIYNAALSHPLAK